MEFDFRSLKNKENHSLFVADNSGLMGGSGGAPTVEVVEVRAASINPFYEPIPFDMSY